MPPPAASGRTTRTAACDIATCNADRSVRRSSGILSCMSRASNDDIPIGHMLELATQAALGPSSLILSGFRNPALLVEGKSDGSPVTAFDREAEQQIRRILGSDADHRWPVLGEEFGGDTADSPYRWVVDPIDGTMPYSRGLPYFGTLVAFEDVRARRALVGAIQLPAFADSTPPAGDWVRAVTERHQRGSTPRVGRLHGVST